MSGRPRPAPAPYDRIPAATTRVLRGLLTEEHRYQLAELLVAFEVTHRLGYVLPEPLDARLAEAVLSLAATSVDPASPAVPGAGEAG